MWADNGIFEVGGLYLLRHRRMWWLDRTAFGWTVLRLLVAGDSERTVAMFRLIWTASAHARYFLRRYMPTNIALDAIRSRRGLRWGVPTMLLALPYLYAASVLTTLIADGAPGWLHLLVLLLIWNAMKFLVMGPISLLLLVRAKTAEPQKRRITHHAAVGRNCSTM